MQEHNVNLRQAIAGVLALAALPVMAQEPERSEGPRAIETVIVTAQKREQSLQDVPMVVTAVSEQLLQDTGVRDIKDLTLLTPGMIVTSTSNESQTTVRIRGIGTVGDNPGLESSVGVVIDGVYRPRNGVSFGDLGELERIEVLKGPQGTLFGKNTSAGVINVVSKKPSFDYGTNVELTAGNYSAHEGSASINVPFSDQVAARLFVAGRERDGFLDVQPRDNDEDFNRKFYTVRGQLLFKPSDALDVRLVADYTDHDEDCCLGVQRELTNVPQVLNALQTLAPGNAIANPADPFERDAFANRSTRQSIIDKGVSMELNWDINNTMTLTSITAARDWRVISGQDSDHTGVDILYREDTGGYHTDFEQFSQELRLSGNTERFNWLVGAFYADEKLKFGDQLLYGNQFYDYYNTLLSGALGLFGIQRSAFPAGEGQSDEHKQDSESWALFTNNSLRITDALELTVGLRYTNESKDLDSRFVNSAGGSGCTSLRALYPTLSGLPRTLLPASALATIYGIGCATFADPLFDNRTTSQSIDESEWSGTAKLAYRFTEEAMAYVSYARGYKASGFNLGRERTDSPIIIDGVFIPGVNPVQDDDSAFPKETVDSYEIGAKTQWFGNSLYLNGAVFYQKYENFQLNTFTGITFVVRSLPKVVSQGVDLDFIWRTPLEQLSLQGGITYAETEIREFGAAESLFRPERKNDRLSFAPKWSSSLAATFEQPVADNHVFRTVLGLKHMTSYNTGSNLDPRKIQDSLTLLNARVGFGADDERWMLELWAQNLTDEDYIQVAFDATLQGQSGAMPLPTSTIDAFLGAPRTYGVTARFKF